MSDEEKEALRNFKSEYETCDHYSSALIIELDDAEILLNLIEKQSKEIEELKDKYSDEKIRNTIIKRYREVIEKDYVSKDKIKAKIEVLDKQEEDLQNSISDEEREEYSDASISWELMDIHTRREVLQSLLEKE